MLAKSLPVMALLANVMVIVKHKSVVIKQQD